LPAAKRSALVAVIGIASTNPIFDMVYHLMFLAARLYLYLLTFLPISLFTRRVYPKHKNRITD
jgi:hypothetical protein